MGFAISATELPDFLPLFLEFLSTRPLAEARELLGQPAHILTALAERLHKRHSPYAAVFEPSLHLPSRRRSAASVEVVAGRPRCRSQRFRRARRAMGRGGGDVRPGRRAELQGPDRGRQIRAGRRPAWPTCRNRERCHARCHQSALCSAGTRISASRSSWSAACCASTASNTRGGPDRASSCGAAS